MILRAKYLITGDGRTCLQDQAVYLDKEGKIGWQRKRRGATRKRW